MKIEQLREYYVTARCGVIDGKDKGAVISNLSRLYEYVKALFEHGSIVDRVKTKRLYQLLSALMGRIRTHGLQDSEVLAFFHISTDDIRASQGEGEIPILDILSPDDEVLEPIVSPPLDGALGEVLSPVSDIKEPSDCAEGGADGDAIGGSLIEGEVALPSDTEGDDVLSSDAKGDEVSDPTVIRPPQSLDEFIGQTQTVARLKTEIKVARKRGLKHIGNVLLFGSRGLGKSTLMQIIANELGVDFKFLDASFFRNDTSSKKMIHMFFRSIATEGVPVVIGIDELHCLPTGIQSTLLTLLSRRIYSYLDDSGRPQELEMPEFTFIGATTDSNLVLNTVKDRASNLTFYLQDYSHEELSRIFARLFAKKGLSVTEKIIAECIARCRSSIRDVESIVTGLWTLAEDEDTSVVSEAMLNKYFDMREIDSIGLTKDDLRILRAILSEQSGLIALDNLASKVNMDVRVLESEFEPYLIKIGFIGISNRGRYLTDKAIAHLKKSDDGESAPIPEKRDGSDSEDKGAPILDGRHAPFAKSRPKQ